MKLRIIYDGYHDLYSVQYKSWFFWHNYVIAHVIDHCIYAKYKTIEEAFKYLEEKKKEILKAREDKIKDQERHRLAKERAKKSHVVYEEIV